jgi:DNA repair photolyase
MIVKEIHSKTILSRSKVYDYSINPYVGCEYGCTYCYARFMKRFTGHRERWGEFVDAKVNAVCLLRREVKSKRVGRVWISGVCDPYQPLEKRYELTKGCIEILAESDWPVTIQTKSPLVKRDLRLLNKFGDVEVGLTITTADENVRKVFEPNSPSIEERITTLKKLHSEDIKTFAMIAPILPEAEGLIAKLKDKVDYVLVDRMNYHYADRTYEKNELKHAGTNGFFSRKKEEIALALKKEGLPFQILF